MYFWKRNKKKKEIYNLFFLLNREKKRKNKNVR